MQSPETSGGGHVNIYEFTDKNKRDSILLTFFFFVFIAFIGWIVGEIYDPSSALSFVIFAGILAFLNTFISYQFGPQLVLASVNARKPNPANFKEKQLMNIVEELSIGAGIKTPEVYIMPGDDINAFATGKSPEDGKVCVTEGALKYLNRTELSGVIGHELTHIRNYDIRLMTLIAALVGLIALLSRIALKNLYFASYRSRDDEKGNMQLIVFIVGIITIIVAPLVAAIAQAMVSRRREYLADMGSAELTKNPEGLIGALEKIKMQNEGNLVVPENTSHLFFDTPKRSFFENLFSTHPPIDERIRVLRSL